MITSQTRHLRVFSGSSACGVRGGAGYRFAKSWQETYDGYSRNLVLNVCVDCLAALAAVECR